MARTIPDGITLIGLAGRAGSGKSTAANFLTSTYKNTYEETFAGPLKAGLSQIFGIPLDHFSDQQIKNQVNEYWEKSPRELAQWFGTEVMRQMFAEDFWITRMNKRLCGIELLEDDGQYTAGDTVVISDVRFQNEYDYIVGNQGIIIHLTRPGADGKIGILDHASEQGFNLYDKERTFICENNGSISQLHKRIAEIIIATKY